MRIGTFSNVITATFGKQKPQAASQGHHVRFAVTGGAWGLWAVISPALC